jgi:hypothetical protein
MNEIVLKIKSSKLLVYKDMHESQTYYAEKKKPYTNSKSKFLSMTLSNGYGNHDTANMENMCTKLTYK